MTSFNTVATMRRILRIPSGDDSYTDTEIQEYLDEAQSDLFSEIKRENEIDRHLVDYNNFGAIRTRYAFMMGGIAATTDILKIYSNNVEITDSDYTVDLVLNEIIFNDGVLRVGEMLEIYYLPIIYTEAERYVCAFNMLSSSQLLNQDGTTNPIAERYENKYKKVLKTIKNKLQVGTYI